MIYKIYLKIILALVMWLVTTILTIQVINLFTFPLVFLAPQFGFIVTSIVMYYLFELNTSWNFEFKQENITIHHLSGTLIGFLIPAFSAFILLELKLINFQIGEYERIALLSQLIIFLMVAIGEEVFFRGYVFGLVQHYTNTTRATMVNTTIFTIIHLINPHSFEKEIQYIILELTNIFLLGYLFSISRTITKGLYMPIALHLAINVSQSTIFGFSNGGKSVDSILVSKLTNESIWNGSGYGLESSLILTFILLSFIALVHRLDIKSF